MMSEALTAEEVIALFGLKPHPEGGHYRETFRDALGHSDRAHSTAILFLLEAGEVSRWHKVDAAEHWHFHGGAALELQIRDGDARHEIRLGAIGAPVSCHMRSCRRMRGRARAVWVRGRWSAAPSRPASTSQASNSRPTIGSLDQSLSCPRTEHPVTTAHGKATNHSGYWVARSSRAMTSGWVERLAQSMYCPPLTVRVEPVIQPASSAARKVTQRATSSASPSRPTGICPTIDFITSSDTPASRSVAI